MAVTIFDRVPLRPTDMQRGYRWRMFTLWLLRFLSVFALLGTPFAAILWLLTAQACWSTYITRESLSVVLHPDSAASLLQFVVGLDMSTCSALVVLLVVYYLGKNGILNSIRIPWREGTNFRGRAYAYHLFPSWLGNLSVQLGLIGTLFSFVFAALTMIADMQVVRPLEPAIDADGKVAVTAKAAQIPEAHGAAEQAVPDEVKRSGETSQRIFLLLCASLISTLVGTVVAYLVLPFLEGINTRAMGRHQLPPTDPEESVTEFGAVMKGVCEVLDTTRERLGTFNEVLQGADQLTAKVAGANQVISSLTDALSGTHVAMNAMNSTVELAAGRLQETSAKLGEVASRLETNAAKLERNYGLLEQLPARLNEPAQELEAGAKAIGSMAKAAEQAQRNLAEMAKSVKEPIGIIAKGIQNALGIIQRLYDTMHSLLQGEKQQRESLVRVASSFRSMEEYLQTLVGKVLELVQENRSAEESILSQLKDMAAERSSADEITAINRNMNHLDETLAQLAEDLRAERQARKQEVQDVLSHVGRMNKMLQRCDKALRHPVLNRPGDRGEWFRWPWNWFTRNPGRNGPAEQPPTNP